MKKQNSFGVFDIPLSCSVFLEPAIQKYSKTIYPITKETKNFIHEWNKALIDILKTGKYSMFVGDVGNKIISQTLKSDKFPSKCVENAKNVPLHSLHYAIRFSESVNFISKKLNSGMNVNFVELGCGFSPLSGILQSEYKIENVNYIDLPEITEVYSLTAEKVYGHCPTAISWEDAKGLATEKKLNTIVAMGVLPYMSLDEQVSRLKFINSYFQNFLLEIKYNNNAESAGQNVFDLKRLQKLKMDVENAQTLETTMIKNSMRYLHKFICALPDKKYFLVNDRSLFLSR